VRSLCPIYGQIYFAIYLQIGLQFSGFSGAGRIVCTSNLLKYQANLFIRRILEVLLKHALIYQRFFVNLVGVFKYENTARDV
jgi:hypothetical protein